MHTPLHKITFHWFLVFAKFAEIIQFSELEFSNFFQEISLSKSLVSEQREKRTMHVFNNEIILLDSIPAFSNNLDSTSSRSIGSRSIGLEEKRVASAFQQLKYCAARRRGLISRKGETESRRIALPPILPPRFLGGGLDFVKKCRRLHHSIRKRSEKNTWPKEFFVLDYVQISSF